MAFSVNFNGVELSGMVDGFTAITRNIGSSWNNSTRNRLRIGADFINSSIGSKSITVNFIANVKKDRFVTTRNSIASALNVTEPAPLIFGDDPNKVWYAIPDGAPTLDESSFYQAIGSITFLVPDGHAYSTYSNVLNLSNSGGINGSITPNSDGSVDITINNQGTLPAWINLTLTNNHENGYFGIAGVNGSLEIGKREEVDGVVLHNSEILYDSKTDPKFSKFVSAAGQPHPEWTGAGTNGTIGYQEYSYKSWDGSTKKMSGMKLIDPGSQTGFRGGMQVLVLPPDSNGQLGCVDFYAWFRLFTWTTNMGQTGCMQILFTDANDKFVGGYGTLKDDRIGNIGTVGFWTGGNNPGEWKNIPYVVNNGEQKKLRDNNTMLNENAGQLDFYKKGAEIGFYWKNGHQRTYIPELENVAIAKVYFFFGNWSTNPRGTMTHMVIRDFWCRKDNVQKWDDLPNRYKQGSSIAISMANGGVSIDGISSITEIVTGTEPFSIPPGISQIKIIQSSWNNTPPDVEISWQERIL
ncbi:phage tail protein [Lactococcus lactis]|uniref:distal tail protein Dit n=1 Tax=Lactococcus lactis TaxID=1358 RepID=UPI00223B9114|nr:distal tail protein Dit [Lactococcus lactis]MCT1194055.1 phage tail protein [Lactococcus lactis]